MKAWTWKTTYLDDDTRIVRADVTGKGEDDRVFYMKRGVSRGASTVNSEQTHSSSQLEELLKRVNAMEKGYGSYDSATKLALAEATATIAATDLQIEELLNRVNALEAAYASGYEAATKLALAEATATIAAKDRQIEELLKRVNSIEEGYSSLDTDGVDMGSGSDDDTSSTSDDDGTS